MYNAQAILDSGEESREAKVDEIYATTILSVAKQLQNESKKYGLRPNYNINEENALILKKHLKSLPFSKRIQEYML